MLDTEQIHSWKVIKKHFFKGYIVVWKWQEKHLKCANNQVKSQGTKASIVNFMETWCGQRHTTKLFLVTP